MSGEVHERAIPLLPYACSQCARTFTGAAVRLPRGRAVSDRPDLKDPDLYHHRVPYDVFEQLRRDEPVYWNEEADGPGFWALTRHADIVEVGRRPDIFSPAYQNGGHRIFNENEVGLTGAGDSAVGIPFISRDPPIHTQYRKLVMQALVPARLGDIEQRVEERIAGLLAKVPLGETIDLVPLLSAPLPLLTLAELLGLPADIWPKLYHWTNAFVGEDDPEFRQSPESMAQTMAEFFAFSKALFDARRASPGDDIASLLANAEIDGVPVPFRDFVGNLILVLVGGNETTRNSLSHTMVAFADNPDQWDAIRADPDILKTAPAEFVRMASPVMHMRRTATSDVEIGGQAIAMGDKVVMWYVRRRAVQHVGFGAGQHFCVGSRLAEMQLRVAFRQLARMVRRFEVERAPRRFRSNFINGLKNLDVKLVPA